MVKCPGHVRYEDDKGCTICGADVSVVQIGGTTYTKFEDIKKYATDGSTIKLLADTGFQGTVEYYITFSRSVTLDLNGHTLRSKDSNGTTIGTEFINTTTITGPGTVDTLYVEHGEGRKDYPVVTVKSGMTLVNPTAEFDGTLILEDGVTVTGELDVYQDGNL